MNCSFSPQISDSNAEPAAVKWQVTVQSRPAKRSVCPMPVCGKRCTRRLPTQTSARPDVGRCPSVTLTLDRTSQARSLTPRTTTLATCVVSNTLPSGIRTYTSGDTSGRPSAAVATCRSEEHTSELQSHVNLVCRLLLEKKKINRYAVIWCEKKNDVGK